MAFGPAARAQGDCQPIEMLQYQSKLEPPTNITSFASVGFPCFHVPPHQALTMLETNAQ
jgi:hypothetical protein